MVFGAGSVERLGALTRELGMTHVLLVADPGIVASGHAASAERVLRAARIGITSFHGFDANPDTVVTLVGGIKYVVAESLDELLAKVRDFRGQVIATAYAFESAPAHERNLRVVTPGDPDLAHAKDV